MDDNFGIACGPNWEDCQFFDPDICLAGECILEDSPLWEDDYGYNEDDQPF